MTDILDPNYESDLTEEEHNQLVLMSKHAVAPPLSPAAQAVLDAFNGFHELTNRRLKIAAALRAAADQVVPDDGPRPDMVYAGTRWEERQQIRAALLAIAAELEGSNA